MITGINHLTLATCDVETSFLFYKDILGFTPVCKWEAGAYFLIGNFWFCLNLDPSHIPTPGYTHYAFSVSEENFTSLSEKIIESGAVIFKENTSPGKSLYFLDPEGHKLEIHVGSVQSRIESKKGNEGNWKNPVWFL